MQPTPPFPADLALQQQLAGGLPLAPPGPSQASGVPLTLPLPAGAAYPPHMQQLPQQPTSATALSASTGSNGRTAAPTDGGGAAGGSGSGSGAKKGVKRNAAGGAVGGGSGGAGGGAGNSAGGGTGKTSKEKKTRSKAACSACKSVKQKCEGPPYIPCRRCELYKLECKFPPGTKTIPRPPDGGTAGTGAGGETSAAMTEKLYEIANRLQSIESALHIRRAASPPPHSHSSPSHHPASPSHHSSQDDTEDEGSVNMAAAAAANPMSEINAAAELAGLAGSGRGPAPRMTQMDLLDYGAPDVLRRSVLSPEECQQLFDFFFMSLHPWIMMLSLDEDRNAMLVRQRSPLLFHTILLLTSAYSLPFPSQLHLTLVTFLNNILAPQLLNPQPHEINTDFLRAMDLCTLYKQVQWGTRRAEGMDDAEAVRVTKVNGLASWSIQSIFSRTAERLELHTVVGKFARAYSASASGTPIPKEIIRDLRLWFWLLSNDVHGNVQSGRRCNLEGAQALTVTRLFSSLNLQPYDVRLAASVEMFEVARPILRSYNYERTRRIPKPDLERFNQGMKTFEETWVPVLIKQLPVDNLAMSVVSPFAAFITLQFNTTCYCHYKRTRMFADSSDSSDPGRPGTGSSEGRNKRLRMDGMRGLNDWEMEGLKKCVAAAELLVFTLSEESRVPGAWRKVQWEEAERQDGWRKLVMDDQMVETTKWGMDAVTCIAYIFPLVFLSKLVNEGLLTTNLTLLRNPTPQPAWQYTQKLPRLLELGAAFLDAIAPNPYHPAKSQAQVLRTLLDTGIRGRLPSPANPNNPPSPTGPTNAATVMSPSPTAPSLPYLPPQPAAYPDSSGAWSGAQPPPPHQPPQPYSFPPASGPTPPPAPGPAPPVLIPGMDEALGSVLNDFEPYFAEPNGGFWEWGGFGANGLPGGLTPVAGSMGTPTGGAPGLPADWPAGLPPQPNMFAQPHPHFPPPP